MSMQRKLAIATGSTCLLALLLLVVCAAPSFAQTTTLQAQLINRPLVPDEINANKLPATVEKSGGLNTIGLGEAAYLEADVDIKVPASQIASVKWSLDSQPTGSKATLEESPLPSTIGVFLPSDQAIYQVAGRKLLRPDVAGVYNISATVTTSGSGVATLQMMIIAGDYIGISGCSKCHLNGPSGTIFSMVKPWQATAHASIFTNNINGQGAQENGKPYPYTAECWGCHTVGFDTNATTPNAGFSNLMDVLKWTPPTVFQPGNFAAMPAGLQNVANIQCENCHGAGSNHAATGGDIRLVTASDTAGTCLQCHSEAPYHPDGLQWTNSAHAATTTDPAGNAECVGCHTSNGFVNRINGVGPVDLSYSAITCQTCHEPHGVTNTSTNLHLVRTLAPVTLANGTKITTAGAGTLCMNCHQARVDAATYVASTPGSTYFGPHEGPQSDMLMGTNGFTYGQEIPSSAHGDVAADTCVTCHMQSPAATDPAIGLVGGHTFNMSFAGTASIPAEEMVGACQTCHGPEITKFDFPLMDYDGDGKIDGAQTEVQHLLADLAVLLPPVGTAKTSISIDSTWTLHQLEAAYNYQFVTHDGSFGIHNMAYTVGLLKASIADLKANPGK